jgi:hypothetical protein
MNSKAVVKWCLVGMAVTPVCLALAWISAGAGHGTYGMARVFYPYSMLLVRLTGSLTTPLLVLAVTQFPMYGCVLGLSVSHPRMRHALLILFALHVAAVVGTFSGLLSDFCRGC